MFTFNGLQNKSKSAATHNAGRGRLDGETQVRKLDEARFKKICMAGNGAFSVSKSQLRASGTGSCAADMSRVAQPSPTFV
jgi:hypothetical protein